MNGPVDWRPASEAICREAYRHLLVHNLAFYRLLPELDLFSYIETSESHAIYAYAGDWRWFIAAWTYPGREVRHQFQLFVWPPEGEDGLTIAKGQFFCPLVPIPVVGELP
ncbi:MAG: hypothetical protein MUE52_04320 [Tabrizicola sp.]|jgi:hypothetical protein|nr:hypothetical protein [Tabrizicola sp.]